MGIGSFYNTKAVKVGQAMGLYAAPYTALPADSIALFDEASWASSAVSLNGATGGTWGLTLGGGRLPGVVAVTGIASTAIASAVASAVTAALNAAGVFNVVPIVSGSAGAFSVALTGPGAARIAITGTGTLTGGSGATPTVTPPLWTPAGATEQGWTATYSPSTQDINIEEQSTPVGRNVASATYEFVANLSENSIESLKLALSANRTISAPDSTHFGVDELRLSSDLPTLAVVLETASRLNFPRRYYIPEAACAVAVGQSFARARGAQLVPVTFSSVCPIEDIRIREITANHT